MFALARHVEKSLDVAASERVLKPEDTGVIETRVGAVFQLHQTAPNRGVGSA